MSKLIVTVDGPTAAGKTSSACNLSELLGIYHLKGGIFFRSITYYCVVNNISLHNEIVLAAASLDLKIRKKDGSTLVFLEGKDISNYLWTPKVDERVSQIAGIADVRKYRKIWLRNIAYNLDLVADGRTLGSELFPEAQVKFYLTANLEIRAKRRYEQYKSQCTFEEIINAISRRDENDQQGALDRTIAPTDSILIDSSNLTLIEVVSSMFKHVQTYIKANKSFHHLVTSLRWTR